MADVVDKATRSRMMSGIRAKDTRPELFIRKGLHALGFRYRLHARDIPGKPDMVFPKYNALIEVHGCFWHGHGCSYFKWPKSNQAFWKEKIKLNRQRDRRSLATQEQLGWRVLVVWECAVRKNMSEHNFDVVNLVAQWLVQDTKPAFLDENGVHHR
ncbi:MAG TPA: DNA mismatch endonuclease Vsr [Gallionella sp.]|nr:DNA mismatch endonuclease Vsr [Gallionella sp.]